METLAKLDWTVKGNTDATCPYEMQFLADLEAAFDWYSVETAEDGFKTFYINEHLGIKTALETLSSTYYRMSILPVIDGVVGTVLLYSLSTTSSSSTSYNNYSKNFAYAIHKTKAGDIIVRFGYTADGATYNIENQFLAFGICKLQNAVTGDEEYGLVSFAYMGSADNASYDRSFSIKRIYASDSGSGDINYSNYSASNRNYHDYMSYARYSVIVNAWNIYSAFIPKYMMYVLMAPSEIRGSVEVNGKTYYGITNFLLLDEAV